MLNIKTVYRKKLFENLKNGRFILNSQRQNETQKLSREKKEENKRCSDSKKLISRIGKVQSVSQKKKRINVNMDNFFEVLNSFHGTNFKRPRMLFKLGNVIDIFFSTNIPPIIKSKRNVIVVIENDNLKKINYERSDCPACLKQEMLEEIKKKIALNIKDAIVMIRKKIIRGLRRTREEFVVEDRTKPAFLIMDDLLAPFPEMETTPIPVFSFTEDKRPKCKAESERNASAKKSPNNREIFLKYWEKTSLLKSEKLKASSGQKKSAQNEEAMLPPPLCPEDCLDTPENLNIFRKEEEIKDLGPEITCNNCNLEIVPKMKHSNRENKPQNDKRRGYNVLDNEKKCHSVNQNTIHHNNLLNGHPDVIDMVEDVSLSTLDLANPSALVIPVLKPKEKGTRNIIIKLKNVPDCVDVIKVRSIMSSIYNACDVNKYKNYFLKTQSKPRSYDNQRRKIHKNANRMTSPNKFPKPSGKLFIPNLGESKHNQDQNQTWKSSSDRMTANNSNLRCYRKKDCFYDE